MNAQSQTARSGLRTAPAKAVGLLAALALVVLVPLGSSARPRAPGSRDVSRTHAGEP